MIINRFFFALGDYFLLLKQIFSKPEKFKQFRKQVVFEIDTLGIDSIWIVLMLSLFMGAAITIQTAFQIESSWVPKWTTGFIVRTTMIMEFSPTIISLILAGKVGSRIASEIGTMRVTEQIDALEIMGINSACHLILPKIVACMLINPVLIVFSIAMGLYGGYAASAVGPVFVDGLLIYFRTYDVVYALMKSVVFGFIIASVSGYFGYKTSGGALEVGKSSTEAVVWSSTFILAANLLLTQILLF